MICFILTFYVHYIINLFVSTLAGNEETREEPSQVQNEPSQAEVVPEQEQLQPQHTEREAATGKGRTKAYRERMKQDDEKYSEMKRKDAQRKRIARATRKELSYAEVTRERELNTARVRKFRANKKEENLQHPDRSDEEVDEETSLGSYASRQTLGKAFRKVKSALPKSPRKRKAVVSKLAISEMLWNRKKLEHRRINKELHDAEMHFTKGMTYIMADTRHERLHHAAISRQETHNPETVFKHERV